VDLAREEVELQGMILEQIAAIAIPRPWYLQHINPDGTLPFEDVSREVKAQAWLYYHLVVTPHTTAKGIAKSAQHSVVDALDIYDLFCYVTRL
jgi:hypothetical protein